MYMIYQQYQTAIKNSYTGKQDLQQHVKSARKCREWLESLEIDVELRNSLVEPILVLQEVFQELVDHTQQSTKI